MITTLMNQSIYVWGAGLSIGLIIATIFLGELVERLLKTNNPLAEGLQQLRNFVIPLLVLSLALRHVIELDSNNLALRTIETLFWISLVPVGLKLISNVMRLGQLNPDLFVSRLPSLPIVLSRAGLVTFVLYYIVTVVWQIDISSFFTAFGIGALAISFALQDTLSNLVSGFLLLADRPFRTDDWVTLDGERMKVIEVNWRTSRFRRRSDWSQVIIPNGVLDDMKIVNHGSEETPFKTLFFAGFSYDDPPNRVKQILYELLAGQPDIKGKVQVRTWGYGDFSINYRIEFWAGVVASELILERLQTQIFYVAQRYGLTIPFPTSLEYKVESVDSAETPDELISILRESPLLSRLSATALTQLAESAHVRHYGIGEQVMREGYGSEGLYVIRNGGVQLSVLGDDAIRHDLVRLEKHGIFGELTLMSGNSHITATVETDATIIVLDSATVLALTEQDIVLSGAINTLVAERRRLLNAVRGEVVEALQNSRAEWVDFLRRVDN